MKSSPTDVTWPPSDVVDLLAAVSTSRFSKGEPFTIDDARQDLEHIALSATENAGELLPDWARNWRMVAGFAGTVADDIINAYVSGDSGIPEDCQYVFDVLGRDDPEVLHRHPLVDIVFPRGSGVIRQPLSDSNALEILDAVELMDVMLRRAEAAKPFYGYVADPDYRSLVDYMEKAEHVEPASGWRSMWCGPAESIWRSNPAEF